RRSPATSACPLLTHRSLVDGVIPGQQVGSTWLALACGADPLAWRGAVTAVATMPRTTGELTAYLTDLPIRAVRAALSADEASAYAQIYGWLLGYEGALLDIDLGRDHPWGGP